MLSPLFVAAPTTLLLLALASPAQESVPPTASAEEVAQLNAKLDALFAELDDRSAGAGDASKLSFGGYGEYHANFIKDGAKFADPHRFVFYLGYDFGSGIQLHSETEIEHGFVADDNGEVSVEQLYADIALGDAHALSIGRMLAPLGIINKTHEPTTFNGVERPGTETYIIPSTWRQDGVGLHSALGSEWSYEVQLTSGLDGSGFDATNGIRKGRLGERPGLGNPALSGRVDWSPEDLSGLRFGASFFSGGADNGNKGVDPDVDARVDILALDFDYERGRLDLRGLLANSRVSGAAQLNSTFGKGVGKAQTGSYLEAAWHLFDREADREGYRFPESDLVVFVRAESYDTQDELPVGLVGDPTAARQETTIGIGWWLTPKFVIKADYQFLDYESSGPERADQLNLGIGWML